MAARKNSGAGATLAPEEPPKAIVFRHKFTVAGAFGPISFDPNVIYRDPAMIRIAIESKFPFDSVEE
jgi:hypothetical protein